MYRKSESFSVVKEENDNLNDVATPVGTIARKHS
jgi:hypothetical protein